MPFTTVVHDLDQRNVFTAKFPMNSPIAARSCISHGLRSTPSFFVRAAIHLA
jgi:hypothetical protein